MTITAIRYRTEGVLVVLQVQERVEREGPYSYSDGPKWRDAKVEDLLDVASVVTKERVIYLPNSSPPPADQRLPGDYGYSCLDQR